MLRTDRTEQGSVAMTMIIAFIATALTAALLTTVFRDLRVSRRSGDSANALQAADAGVNEAVKAAKTAAGTTGACAEYPLLPGFVSSAPVGNASYSFCAAKDVDAGGRTIWHVNSLGTDASGVKRRVKADAVAEPLFPNALEVFSTTAVGTGFTLDSYKDELLRCTKKGNLGINDPSLLSWPTSGGGSSKNCQDNPPLFDYPYPVDGCIAYSRDGTAVIEAADIGNGKCPPSTTTTASPELSSATRRPPANPDFPASGAPGPSYVCSAPELIPGKIYYFSSVTLSNGCGVNPASLTTRAMDKPVEIYTNALTITGGTGAGNAHRINRPPSTLTSTHCGATHGQSGANPDYCPGWPGGLQIFVLNGGSVSFSGNHSFLWGLIHAPSATAGWTTGAPSWEIFGAMVAQSVSGGVTARWHYDEALGSILSGRFFPKNWRAEPT